MNDIFKSMDCKHHAQVFANNASFSKVYPIYSKRKDGEALKLFSQEFGVQEKLTFGVSK